MENNHKHSPSFNNTTLILILQMIFALILVVLFIYKHQ
jgi:hypothetical protein